MPIARAIRLAAACLSLSLLGLPLVGCSGDSAFRVEPTGPAVPMGAPLAVDVENQFGSVRVIAEPWVTAPVVEARLRSPNWTGGTEPARRGEDAWVAAETVEQSGRYVLRVLADTPTEAAERVHVDLTVRVPACQGLLVRNSGGPVRARGVGGAIEIHNGTAGRPGGLIEVRTNEPIVDPVRLEASQGDIIYFVGPESSGVFDVAVGEGSIQIAQRVGTLSMIRPTPTTYSAVFNEGDNPVVIRTGRGVVEIRLVENAQGFRSVRSNVP